MDNASLLPQVLAGERLTAQRSPQVSVSVWQDMYVEICLSRQLIISVYPKSLVGVCVMEEIIKIEKKIISQWANVVQLGLRMIATDVKPD